YGQPYDTPTGSGIKPPDIEQLVSVSNTLGRTITFPNDGQGTITGISNGIHSASISTTLIPTATTTFKDQSNKPTQIAFTTSLAGSDEQRPIPHWLLNSVTTADNLSQPNMNYVFDSLGRVKEIWDAVAIQQGTRGPYQFLIADGTRGERDDPLGQPYAVVYD